MDYPNWFLSSNGPLKFSNHLHHFKDKPIRALQIGVYTGDASKWLLENILTHPDSVLDDVDTWEGADEPGQNSFDWNDLENTYLLKNKEFIDSGKIQVFKSTSDSFFKNLDDNVKYDFIYIDGDHQAKSVLKDSLNAIDHLNKNGIMAFDDYVWALSKGDGNDPRTAIDMFYSLHKNMFDVLEVSNQCWVRLKSNNIKEYRVGG